MNYFGYNQKDIDAVAKIENEKRWSVLSEEQKRVLYKDECEVYVRMELVAALVLKDFIKKYQKLYGEYKTRTDINEEAGFIVLNLPYELLQNMKEWANDIPLTDIEYMGISIVDVLGKNEGFKDSDFLRVTACFSDSKKYHDSIFKDYFYMHVLSRTPILLNSLHDLKGERRIDSLQENVDRILSFEKKHNIKLDVAVNVRKKEIIRHLFMLDLADFAQKEQKLDISFDAAIRFARDITNNIPFELLKNVREYLNHEPLSEIVVNGWSVRKLMYHKDIMLMDEIVAFSFFARWVDYNYKEDFLDNVKKLRILKSQDRNN